MWHCLINYILELNTIIICQTTKSTPNKRVADLPSHTETSTTCTSQMEDNQFSSCDIFLKSMPAKSYLADEQLCVKNVRDGTSTICDVGKVCHSRRVDLL